MGNFNIDISTLGKFADYAKQADANKNNILDENEISVFKSKITKEEILKSNILKSDMGLLVENSIMTQEEVDDMYLKKLNKLDKVYSKKVLQEVAGYLITESNAITMGTTKEGETYKKKGELSGLVDYLKNTLKGNEEYKFAIKQVEELEAIINNSGIDLKTKKGIDELSSGKFARKNNLTKFQKDVMEYFVYSYERQAVEENIKKVEEIYQNIITPKDDDTTKENANSTENTESTQKDDNKESTKETDSKKKSSNEIMNEVKKKLKEENLWNTEYYKDAYNMFAEELAKKTSQEFLDELKNETGTELTKRSMINKYAKGDKLKTKIVKDSKSLIDMVNRKNTIMQKIEASKSMTKEEIKKQLGKDILAEIEATSDETSTIDMQQIGNWILECIGQDYNVNYSEKADAEITNLQKHLRTHNLNFTEKEIKKLLDFYEIPYEGKYDAKKLPLALAIIAGGALTNSMAPLATNSAFKGKTKQLYPSEKYTIPYHHKESVHLDLTEQLQNAINNGTLTINGDHVIGTIDGHITCDIEIDKIIDIALEFPEIRTSLAMAPQVLKSAVFSNAMLGALLTLPHALEIMKRPDEANCFGLYGTDILKDNMPLEDYVTAVKKAYVDDPEAQDFYITLAGICSYVDDDENGNKFKRIDLDAVEEAVKWMKGLGSNLNCEEITALNMFGKAEKDGLKIEPKPDCEPCPEYPDGQEDSEDPEGTGSIGNKTPEITPFTEYQCVKVDVTTYDMRNSSWNKMVQAYDSCLLEKCGNNIYLAGRVLKVIQGIDPNLYNDIGTLVEIARYSMKHGVTATKTKYGEYFQNFGRFEHYINTPDLNNIILPDNIDDCKKIQDFSYKATPTRNPYTGSPYGMYQSTAKQDVKIATFGYTDADGNEYKFNTEKERSAAIVNEISKNPKTKINEPIIRNCDN